MLNKVKMLDKQKESLRKLSRLDQDPKRLKILRKQLGEVDRSKDLGTTRQYIAPNSALIAKGGRILFEPKETVLEYLQNTDVIYMTRIQEERWRHYKFNKRR